VRDVDWNSKVLVRASYDLFLQCATKVIFIFSRDNPLSSASNLLLTDPITASYALPGSSISTWQVEGSEGGIIPDTGLRKLEVAVGKLMERN
jgi:hypothetical protein